MATTEDTLSTEAPAPAEEPEQTTEEVQAAPAERTVVWASRSSLPIETSQDFPLPYLGEMVRVRYMTNMEAAQLALLPDLLNFTAIMASLVARAQQEEGDETIQIPDEVDQNDYQVEKLRYMSKVAHMCVMDPDAPAGKQPCSDTGCGVREHPASLWTVTQCEMLDYADLELVCAVAERSADVASLRPFSQDQTQPSTPTSASSGESTPE